MDALDRLSTGEKIAGLSAVLLFVFMFFDWFAAKVSGVPGFSGGVEENERNAWQALDFIPIILVATIIAVLVLAAIRLSDANFDPVVPMSVIVAVMGGISVLLIIYRVIDPPNYTVLAGVETEITRKIGLFLGLIAAGGIAYGGYKAMEEEGITFGDAADRLGGSGGGHGPGDSGPSDGPPAPPPPPSSSTPPPPPPPPPPA